MWDDREREQGPSIQEKGQKLGDRFRERKILTSRKSEPG